MALISCSECKKEVSDTVKRCPHCGFVMRRIQWNWWIVGPYVISALALIFVLVDVNAVVDLTTDTFIGIMASFIGAVATIIVGAQIYNSIEAKRLMNDIGDRQNRLDTNLEEAYKSIGTIDSKIEVVNSRIADFDNKMKVADSRFNELYSLSAFMQAYSVKDRVPFEAYENCINSLYWELRSDSQLTIVPCLRLMDEIIDNLEQRILAGEYVQIDYFVNDQSIVMLEELPKYKDERNNSNVKLRFEVLENRRKDIEHRIKMGIS